MENLPPIHFSIGTPPSNSVSGRQRRAESQKRPRQDGETVLIPSVQFKDIVCIPKLFPSLLCNHPDIPASVKIVLATEGKRFLERHAYIQQKTLENIRFLKFVAAAPRLNSLYPNSASNGIMDRFLQECKTWFALEQKVRLQFRRIVQAWLFKRYKGRTLNDTDPCTLEPITTPVRIFDTRARGYYQFDAKSLRRTLEFNLGFQDWMFPDPRFPKNPLTNLEFNYGQLIELQKGVRQAGLGSWLMEGFALSNWNLEQFKLNYSVPLKLHAIKTLYKNPQSEQMQEFLVEFIEDQWEDHEIPTVSTKTILRWAVANEMDDPYMQKWLDVWYEYFKLKVQYGLRDASSDRLNAVFAKTLLLLENSQKIAEFGERRLASIRSRTRYQTPIQFPPLQLPETFSTIQYLMNPMHATGVPPQNVILNPEDHDNEQDEQQSNSSTETTQEEETLVFSTPQEIASFLAFLSQLLPDGQENPQTDSGL